MQTVIYPGTFDPVTRGHLDLIERASKMFERVIVAVGDNPAKKPMFSARERMAMVRAETRALANIEAMSFRGLLIDFARKQNCALVIRGLRTVTDFEYELQMALTNRAASGLETIFLTPSPKYQFLSAQLIREIGCMGGDVSALLTPGVEKKMKAKCRARKKTGARS
jgi:pantetheine-phosphate adenylyltransferase